MKTKYLWAILAILTGGCNANSTIERTLADPIAKPAQPSPRSIHESTIKEAETTRQLRAGSTVKPVQPLPTMRVPESAIKEPEKLQYDRRNLIISLIHKGVFDRIQMSGENPVLWIGPLFTGLDFQTKSKFVEVVWAYYFDGPDQKVTYAETVYLKDMYSGKIIGSYSPFAVLNPGLRLR